MITWDDLYRIACGEMGLSPDVFGRMTYAELRVFLDGCYERQKREIKVQRELDACLAATLINHLGMYKEPITAAMLLGRKSRRKVKSREEQMDDALNVAFSKYVRTDAE
ncbi:phage tail assembly chaperone [Silvibacterium acidisoli]|uniref:phage tail assembly chaperone n=1 Tax=Acidobacteriaceae bacterium ZG23-2 TaxID=2883246 RepID=UPI00406D27B2